MSEHDELPPLDREPDADAWTRFDLYAGLAKKHAEEALAHADNEGQRNTGDAQIGEVKYDPRAQTRIEVARVFADLAAASVGHLVARPAVLSLPAV